MYVTMQTLSIDYAATSAFFGSLQVDGGINVQYDVYLRPFGQDPERCGVQLTGRQ